MVVKETLNNIVRHADATEVEFQMNTGDDALEISIADNGKGFDPNTTSDALDSEGLNADHGRGIHLVKRMMDEVSFESGGTEVQMRKRPARGARTESQANK